jgi:hypothetical protein
MSATSTIIERVQKLLALSKSTNASEAANAAAIANRLIDQHRLSEADLEVHSEVCEPPEQDDGFIYTSGRINPWKVRLMNSLITHYGLACWNDADWTTGRQVSRFRLVGRKSDITIAKYMFTWLSAECQRLSDKEAKGKGHVYVNSYCMGFVNGISTQLKSTRAEVQKSATSAAIIKIDARSKEAEDFMNQLNSNLRYRKGHSKSQMDYDAFSQGKSKGESMHLGAALGAGKTKLLGG